MKFTLLSQNAVGAVVLLVAFVACNKSSNNSDDSTHPSTATGEASEPDKNDPTNSKTSGDSPAEGEPQRYVLVHAPPTAGDVSALVAKNDQMSMIEQFSSGDRAYSIVTAPSQQGLEQTLTEAAIKVDKISSVLDTNNPERGGGTAAGDNPSAGHSTFVIERPIPGVGTFPAEKKKKISMKSNEATSQMEGSIEWVHSYLTQEGTYCVYRATDETKIRDHAQLTGAPISKITEVTEQ